jgi:hypothetical protein
MNSKISGLVRSRPGLLAGFFLVIATLPVHAEDKLQAEPAPEPVPAPSQPPDAPPPGYPPPGYPPPGYPPPGYYPQSGYYPPLDNSGAPSPYPSAAYDPMPAAPTITAAPPPPDTKTPPPFTFGATLATSVVGETNANSVVLSPLLEGAYEVYPAVLLDLAWGASWVVDNQGIGESTARVGNPMLSGYYRTHVNAWRVRAGLGVTAPLAHYPLGPDGRLYAFVYNQTMATWGMWNQWLWTTDRTAVPVSGRADYAFSSGHVLSAEVAVAPIMGARGGATGTDLVGQMAVETRLPIGASFVLCPRLQTVFLPSTSVDRLQTAFGLRGILDTPFGKYFAGLLVNLDEPLGVFGGLGRWGLHLGKEIGL